MADSKAVQEAESRARAEAGIDPAMMAHATQGSDADGARGDPAGDRPARAQAEPEPQRTAPPVKSKFDDRRAEIVSRFRTNRNEQGNEERDDITDFARSGLPPEFEAPQPVPAQEQDALEPEAAQEAGEERPAAQTVRVKVHGVEKDIPLDELIGHAQKAMAADNILEEAKSSFKELEGLVNEARKRVERTDQHQVRQPDTRQPTEAQPDPDADPEHHEDPLVKLIESMQFGDPKENAPLLRNTIAEQVTAGVKQQLQAQRLQDEGARAAKVLSSFEGQHPEIAKDPMARAAIEAAVLNQQVEDIVALGVNLNRIRPDGLDPTPGDISVAHRWYRSEGFKVSSPETMLEDATKKFLEWKGIKPASPAETAPAATDRAEPRIEISVERADRRKVAPQQPSRSGVPPRTPAPAAPQVRDRSAIVMEEIARRNRPRGRVGVA